ncbi:hypothetical protein GTO27_06580, partial [Candidatus Bathyarchaeota archaeon]|nr:hypothetical protein [Candidatus Bathyarchaeota archaeon]
YLPVSREKITYFKVFEIEAEEVMEISLHEALSRYGIHIPSDVLPEIKPLLSAHIREWINHPKSQWDELTLGNVKKTLVDDERILRVLASVGTTFDSLIEQSRFPIFTRRVLEDFGLPDPKGIDADSWRVKALASIICTEAAEISPNTPPSESERIIPQGSAREKALRMLEQWKNRIDLNERFEALINRADKITSLRFWANNLPNIPLPLSSKIAEESLLRSEITKLTKIEDSRELINQLQSRLDAYKKHAEAFWGRRA